MQVPLQIVFEHIGHSDALEAAVRKEAQRLERFHDRITSARVVIARPQHRHHKGDTYSVRIHLAVPGGKHIDISRDPAATGRHEDAHVTIRDAFDAAGRQLQDQARKIEGQVKTHETQPHGKIAKLVPERDHGFIAASDGREIYFHRNSVIEGTFDNLQVGQDVRFSEAAGDKGPQASSVRPVGKHHVQ
ncbi:MAG: HPF/RaiA family ribosome-associated protein [Hyphomicrobiaceae bacterium]|nr:MAG: HPF/RaiA family ribosome-associated protein [Hyphomicrobiaceae bacterium]